MGRERTTERRGNVVRSAGRGAVREKEEFLEAQWGAQAWILSPF